MVGYWWFHWAEMLSKVRRKGAVWPGASGAMFRSTGSRYAPLVRTTRSGSSSRWASWPMESSKLTWTIARGTEEEGEDQGDSDDDRHRDHDDQAARVPFFFGRRRLLVEAVHEEIVGGWKLIVDSVYG